MDEKELGKLNDIFKSFPNLGLVYFFGSRAKSEAGPLSDYDFAVYFDEKDQKKIFEDKIELQNAISKELKTDNVDIVVLNSAENLEIKYNIIQEGKLIFEKEPFKLIVEPRILNEYFDFRAVLLRYGLTK